MDAPNHWNPRRRHEGRVIFGIIIAGFGVLLLLQMFHLLPPLLYSLHFGWPLLLIIIGIAIGIGTNFRKNAWWILIAIGVAHLIPSFYIGDVPSRRLLWPFVLVLAGVLMITRKRRPRNFGGGWHRGNQEAALLTSDTDTINIDVTFSGHKEIITSRAFKGGTLRASFSGVELNLASAESSGQTMVIDVAVSFAGVEIILPSHWELQNEIRPTLGSVEDHRTIRTGDATSGRPLLILRGTVSFGSVELKSY